MSGIENLRQKAEKSGYTGPEFKTGVLLMLGSQLEKKGETESKAWMHSLTPQLRATMFGKFIELSNLLNKSSATQGKKQQVDSFITWMRTEFPDLNG